MRVPHWFFIFVLCAGFAFHNSSFAQAYAGTACTTRGDPQLKEKLNQKKELSFEGIDFGFYQNWATSFLPSSGTAPVVVKEKADGSNQLDVENSQEAHDKWTCQYSAYSVQDGDPKTAWCEGAAGDGVGELLLAPFDPENELKIWVGYGKSPETFQANNRPKKIKVYALAAQHAYFGKSTTEGSAIEGLSVLAAQEVELQDVNGWQTLRVPWSQSRFANITTPVLAIEILSVTKGTKHNDTCISEIKAE